MRKNEKGALTVEACIALTIFLMVFVTILYLMRIVFAYEIVQHALNQTAKEFSTYSYYYAASGLADINGKIQTSTSEGRSDFNKNVTNIVNVYDKFSDLSDDLKDTESQVSSGDVTGVLNSIQSAGNDYDGLKESLGSAADTLKSIANDPKAAIKSIGSVLLNGGNEAAKTFLCGEISKCLMAKYIDSDYDAANIRLKNLRIVNGLDGLDFSSSVFWGENNTNDIQFVVCYTIDPVFPIKIMDEINLVNTVKVRGWSGKSIF